MGFILLSFLDLQFIIAKLKRKELFNDILYILCIGSVVWLSYEKVKIFVQRPTTASLEMIDSKDIPISFTLCKFIYGSRFDGMFSSHNLTNTENISLAYDSKQFDILQKKALSFEFVSYLDYPMMCKEFDLANIEKHWIQFVRYFKSRSEQNRNLHLYIHQPGMFYLQEFRIKYPSKLFKLNPNDKTNENAKVRFESYDISDDPHFPCSSEIHQDCVNREIIRISNSSYGCTYPIQRYNFFYKINYTK